MRLAPMILVLCTFLASASASAAENKWRLQFSGRADSAGTLVLAITPEGGEANQVSIDIPHRLSENRIAKTVTANLSTALGEDYHVERDDGEDVLIKKRHLSTPKFDVVVVSNTIEGVRINLDRE